MNALPNTPTAARATHGAGPVLRMPRPQRLEFAASIPLYTKLTDREGGAWRFVGWRPTLVGQEAVFCRCTADGLALASSEIRFSLVAGAVLMFPDLIEFLPEDTRVFTPH